MLCVFNTTLYFIRQFYQFNMYSCYIAYTKRFTARVLRRKSNFILMSSSFFLKKKGGQSEGYHFKQQLFRKAIVVVVEVWFHVSDKHDEN